MENNKILPKVNKYGLGLIVEPLSEEHNLYKFCYCQDIPTKDTLWGICSNSCIEIYWPICKTVDIIINETYIDARITRHYTEASSVSCIFTLHGELICEEVESVEILSLVNVVKIQNEYYFFGKDWKPLDSKLKNISFKKIDRGINDIGVFLHISSVWDFLNTSSDEQPREISDKLNRIFLLVDRCGKFLFTVELYSDKVRIQKNFSENITYSVCKDKSSISYVKFNVCKDVDGVLIGEDLHLIPKYERVELFEMKKELPLFFIYKGENCGIYYDGTIFFPKYDEITPFDDCRFLTCKNHLYGLLNVTNRRKIYPNYQKIECFGHRVYKVQYNNLWGLVDDDNRWIVPREYNEIIRVNGHIYARKGYNLFEIIIEQDYNTRRFNFPWFNAKMEKHNIVAMYSDAYCDADSPILKCDLAITNLLAPTDNLLELIHSSDMSDKEKNDLSEQEEYPF